MKDVPIFVICRDRLSGLAALVEWLERAGHERIVLVDNDSRFEPTVDYLRSSPHEVAFLGANVGHLSPWKTGLVDRIAGTDRYVVSDCDVVPVEACPPDVIDRLDRELDRYPAYAKAGLGLTLDDIPATYAHRRQVLDWEAQFWWRPVRPGVYHANIDTTFALYRTPHHSVDPALRLGRPYVARHLAWYVDSGHLDVEEEFYRSRADPDMTHWSADEVSLRLPAQPDRLSLRQRLRWRAHRRFRLRQVSGPADDDELHGQELRHPRSTEAEEPSEPIV